MKEEGLVQRLKAKDSNSLNYVLDIYGDLIYRISYSYLHSKELSEECVNDVLLKVWECIDGYDYPEEKFKNWIASIAKHTSIDILRKEKKHLGNVSEESEISSDEDVEESVISKEELHEIKDRIMDFKEIDRKIFIERFFNQKSLKEIAEIFNMTPKAINLRIIRGRKKLVEVKERFK